MLDLYDIQYLGCQYFYSGFIFDVLCVSDIHIFAIEGLPLILLVYGAKLNSNNFYRLPCVGTYLIFRVTTRVVFLYKVLKGHSSFSRSPVKIGSTRFYCVQFLYISYPNMYE